MNELNIEYTDFYNFGMDVPLLDLKKSGFIKNNFNKNLPSRIIFTNNQLLIQEKPVYKG